MSQKLAEVTDIWVKRSNIWSADLRLEMLLPGSLYLSREREKEREKVIKHIPESVDEELLRDVVLAVGVLERKIEFIILVEHIEAGLRLRSRTAQTAARSVNVHLDVFREFPGIMHALISGMAVGNEPGDLIKQRCRKERIYQMRVFTSSESENNAYVVRENRENSRGVYKEKFAKILPTPLPLLSLAEKIFIQYLFQTKIIFYCI